MFGREKQTEEYSNQLVGQANRRGHEEQLENDPSTVPGLTKSQLNEFIDTGRVSPPAGRTIL